MGMDVFGLAPRSRVGEYFSNNIWAWRPLADYCNDVAPDLCSSCKDWYTNSGDGLDDAQAVALAEILQAHVDDQMADSYARMRESVRKAAIAGFPEDIEESSASAYYDTIENVAKFAAFLKYCGGFSIL